MRKIYILIAVFILQLSIPLYMIYENETIVKKGTTVKFKIKPIDPYDAFRGRYLIIETENRLKTDMILEKGEKIFVTLKTDKKGFTTFDDIYLEKPDSKLYIESNITNYYQTTKGEIIGYATFNTGFDRYYINEELAPKAEAAMRQLANKNVYLEVRIVKGKVTPLQLYYDNLKIEDYIRNQN